MVHRLLHSQALLKIFINVTVVRRKVKGPRSKGLGEMHSHALSQALTRRLTSHTPSDLEGEAPEDFQAFASCRRLMRRRMYHSLDAGVVYKVDTTDTCLGGDTCC